MILLQLKNARIWRSKKQAFLLAATVIIATVSKLTFTQLLVLSRILNNLHCAQLI